MTFNSSIVQLPLSHINLDEKRFQITTDSDISNLSESVKTMGLISPPLIYSEDCNDNSHSFTIVSGFRRIKACHVLGMKILDVRIADQNTKEIDLVKIAIAENAFQRQLNLLEKSRAYEMLSRFLPDNNILAQKALSLGLSDSPHMIKKIRLIAHMPESVQQGIFEDSISLAIALELDSFTSGDADILAMLFCGLKLSTSKQREIINLVKDISLCNKITVKEIFKEKEIHELIHDRDIDRNQKAFKLRSVLKQRRYPSIFEAEKTYEKYAKELKLGQKIKLVPPKNFEGTNYSLCLNFSNISELKEQSGIVSRIIHEPALEKILER